MAMWWDLSSTQRQAQKLILVPSPTAKTRLLSFNRIQSRAVTGLLIGLRKHLHLMGLTKIPYGGVQQRRKPQLMFCVSVKPWLHSDISTWVPYSWTLRKLKV